MSHAFISMSHNLDFSQKSCARPTASPSPRKSQLPPRRFSLQSITGWLLLPETRKLQTYRGSQCCVTYAVLTPRLRVKAL